MQITLDLGALIAALVAGIGGWIAIRQYIGAERWKRAEFAIAQVRLLASDPVLAFCCRAIDWGVGPIIIPDKYKVLFPQNVNVVEHDWALMAKALRPTLSRGWDHPNNKAQFLLYRYAFDEFFSYVDALAMYRSLGVVRRTDLEPIEAYLKQVVTPKYWRQETPSPDATDIDSSAVETLRPAQIFGDFVYAFYRQRVGPWLNEMNHG